MAASKDKARAILSYATPNPVGPYRLVTPPSPDLGRKTQTPVMPVVGGPLVNLPTPVAPTKQTTPVAPPLADKFINVPNQQGRVVNKSENWEWGGTKPGEISGTEYEARRRKLTDAFGNISAANRKKLEALDRTFSQQVSDSALRERDIRSLAGDFADLERAGVPRQWTGKLVASLGRPLWEVADERGEDWFGTTTASGKPLIVMADTVARGVSNAMRALTDEERKTFVSLLPQWSGRLDALVDVARSLSK